MQATNFERITVNPNHTAHALDEIARGVASGAVGVKLLASRRADDALNDPICALAEEHGLPILHHIWQHRTREWPNQEISDGRDLARLAARHPRVAFILAHLGGGGDWAHTLPAVVDTPNVYPDLSGSGVDRGMIDTALQVLGAQRLLWACDLTMETGLAKLRALEVVGLPEDDLRAVRWGNTARLFPPGTFPRCVAACSRQRDHTHVPASVHQSLGQRNDLLLRAEPSTSPAGGRPNNR